MTDIAFLLPPGFFTSGVTGLIDAFMLANRQMATRGGPGLRWRLLSAWQQDAHSQALSPIWQNQGEMR